MRTSNDFRTWSTNFFFDFVQYSIRCLKFEIVYVVFKSHFETNFKMFSTKFFVLIVAAFFGMAAAGNNFLTLTYFMPGTNCTTGASGKTQEQYQMNRCTDKAELYEQTGNVVSEKQFNDSVCKQLISVGRSYELGVCQSYDSKNDVRPTAF